MAVLHCLPKFLLHCSGSALSVKKRRKYKKNKEESSSKDRMGVAFGTSDIPRLDKDKGKEGKEVKANCLCKTHVQLS